MCRAAVIHSIDDVYADCNGPGALGLLNRRPARLVWPKRNLVSARSTRPHRLAPHAACPKLTKSLRAGGQFAIESLRRPALEAAQQGDDHARRRIRGAGLCGIGADGPLRADPASTLGGRIWVNQSWGWSSPSGSASTFSTH